MGFIDIAKNSFIGKVAQEKVGKMTAKIKKRTPKIVPDNMDTSAPSSTPPNISSQKINFLKENNLQKSITGRLTLKIKLDNKEHTINVPRDYKTAESIKAFIGRVDKALKENKNLHIKNGNLYKKSLEDVADTFFPNGIESDPVTEYRKEYVDKRIT